MSDLIELIRSRRSIRRYTDESVPAELVERLLTAATWAPSAHNRQPWRFAILEDGATKARLATAMGERLQMCIRDSVQVGRNSLEVSLIHGSLLKTSVHSLHRFREYL